ncbi:putative septation inhibitor protein [Actinomycetales bacterium JB111]|nr:putative septation inhibitor protein [Actinomycetales bacterium JB111]
MPVSKKRKHKDGTPVTRSKQEEEAIEAAALGEPSPTWWAPTMVTLMIVGLVLVLITYLTSADYPVPGIGNWNLAIGFGIAMVGFLMTLRWR